MNNILKIVLGIIIAIVAISIATETGREIIKNTYNSLREGFGNIDTYGDDGGYVHAKIKPDNQYILNNKIQYDFVEILSTFKEMSSKNTYKELKPVVSKNLYTYTNITQLVRQELDQIIKPIIEQSNKKVDGKFVFNLTEYKNAQINQDADGNQQYVVDAFINDMNTHIGLRIRIDAIKYTSIKKGTKEYRDWVKDKDGYLAKALAKAGVPDKGRACGPGTDMETCASETTPGFDSYYIGYPSHEQLIPLPTEVITTGKMVLSADGINTHRPTPIKALYLNYIQLINSDLVLDPYQSKDLAKDIEGMEKRRGEGFIGAREPLEFSKYTRKCKNPNQATAYETNKWPKLDCEPTDRTGWPGTTVPFEWDDLGISPDVKPTKEKPGLTHACRPFPRTAQYWRNNLIVPKWSGNYQWLFSLTSGLTDRHVPL